MARLSHCPARCDGIRRNGTCERVRIRSPRGHPCVALSIELALGERLPRNCAPGFPECCLQTLPTEAIAAVRWKSLRSEEHTSELQSLTNLVCRLLLEKNKKNKER